MQTINIIHHSRLESFSEYKQVVPKYIKTFNLTREADKILQWKIIDRKRAGWISRIEKAVRLRFKEENDMIMDSADNAIDKQTMLASMLEDISSKQNRDAWGKLIRSIFLNVGHDFADRAISDIKKQLTMNACELKDLTPKDEMFVDAEILNFLDETEGFRTTLITETTKRAIGAEFAAGVLVGEGIDELSDRIANLLTGKKIKARAEMIARTEVIQASNFGTISGAKALGIQGLRKTWLCVDGDTKVSGVGITHIARRLHIGQFCEITTISGRVLTVTPEHLVLTGRGWIEAQFIKYGDNLLSYEREIEPSTPFPRAMPNIDDVKPTIKQVFDSIHEPMASSRVVSGVVDLDSVGGNCEVDIELIDGKLRDNLEPVLTERYRKILLESPDFVLGDLFDFGSIDESGGSHSFPDIGFSEHSSGLNSHSRVSCDSDKASFRATSSRSPCDSQTFDNFLAATSVLDRERSDRQPLPEFMAYDRCKSVNIFSSSRHVYDYTTSLGWMIANGLIIHNSTRDSRVRSSHLAEDGVSVDIDGVFTLSTGDRLNFPADGSLGASASTVIQCRCTIFFEGEEDGIN